MHRGLDVKAGANLLQPAKEAPLVENVGVMGQRIDSTHQLYLNVAMMTGSVEVL